MYNEIITLIGETSGTNAAGDVTRTTTRRDVFAAVRSAGMKETYEAMAVGMKPEYTFVLSDYWDFNGEDTVEYEGTEYRVIRTYKKGTELEIVVQRCPV